MKKDPKVTIKSLQQQFVKELSTIDQPEKSNIWKTLEKDLDYDLTSSSSEAVRKRKFIAGQLFPRLTQRQQETLLERQHQRKEYLIDYQSLVKSNLKEKELLAQIEQFIKKSSTPMTSIRKEDLLKKLQEEKELLLLEPTRLLLLKNEIIEECKPSYFNLMKAMYPLLADTYALNQAVYGDEDAGMYIGIESLNITISELKTKPHSSSDAKRLAKNLKNQMTHFNF